MGKSVRRARKWQTAVPAAVTALIAVSSLAGCEGEDDDDDGREHEGDEAACDAGGPIVTGALEAVCALPSGGFTIEIDNPYFPLPVGALRVLEGDEGGTAIRVEHRVLDATERVAGVTTRVLEETEYEDGVLVEISRNYFAQARDGSVCYFGEEVDIYEDDEIVAHEGAWRAGEDGAEAGIVMPANPELGMAYAQEVAPDADAWDHASHVAEGETIVTAGGTFTDTIRTIEWTPIEPDDISRKSYAREVGMIADNEATLTSYEP